MRKKKGIKQPKKTSRIKYKGVLKDARRQAKEERKRAKEERKLRHSDANYPRMSLKSILYTWRIYREAVGPKRFLSAAYNLFNAIIPTVTAILAGTAINNITDAVSQPDHNLMPFLITLSILLLIQLAQSVLSELYSVFSSANTQATFIYVGEKIATKYIQIPLVVRESKEFADKFERVRDYGTSISYVTSSLVNIITSFITVMSALVAAFVMSPVVAIAVALSAIPYSILSLKLAARRRRNWREFTKDRRVAWSIERKLTDSNAALEIELNSLSKHLIGRMITSRRRSQDKDLRDARDFMWPDIGARIIDNIINFLVLLLVAIQIMLGKLALGSFVTFRNLINQLSSSVSSLFMNLTVASENLVNATDFMEFMETPGQPSGDILIHDIPKIEFKHVSFVYPHSERKAINDVSFVLNPGDSLAVVGENGAGKTTLIKLMIGAYTPSEGEILINDQPLERIDRESYLAQIGALFQDFSRYEFATLGENVWFGDVSKAYNRNDISEALELAGLGSEIGEYKEGLNQILSKDLDPDNATDLSGGQWQRVCIARAFFRSPNILVLDEPTSAVDARSEYHIFKNIIEKQQGKTTLIISHRFSTVRKAQRIIVLERGKIIEQGTHEDLIANNGTYKEMFEMQAEGYN